MGSLVREWRDDHRPLSISARGATEERTMPSDDIGTRSAVGGVTASGLVDVDAIRKHFAFPKLGRIVTNNAASTQPPRELLALWRSLAPGYDNVHRGQSSASQAMTRLFEDSYDTVAQFLGAPSRASIALYRNTTEANNAVCTRC
jgi:hypothetical protein